MDSANSKGNETSEWSVAKWVTVIAGILGAALGSLTTALVSSGALIENSVGAVIMGTISIVLLSISGVATKAYIDGRSEVKAAALRDVPPPKP